MSKRSDDFAALHGGDFMVGLGLALLSAGSLQLGEATTSAQRGGVEEAGKEIKTAEGGKHADHVSSRKAADLLLLCCVRKLWCHSPNFSQNFISLMWLCGLEKTRFNLEHDVMSGCGRGDDFKRE